MQIEIILIRISVALVMITFGISELKNPTLWIKEYMPGFIKENGLLPATSIMRSHAITNILLGIIFLLGIFGSIGNVITLIWCISILPFAFYNNWKIGVRDLAIVASILVTVLR